MGIQDLREALKDIPGAAGLTMSYDDGGKTETYQIGETTVSVEAGSTAQVIREAFEAPVLDSVGGSADSSIPVDDDIVTRIRNRIHDAPIETEQLLDEAADEIERLRGVS